MAELVAAASCQGVTRVHRSSAGEVRALVDVDAELPAGRVTAVVGPSGSGKSSLLRLLALVERPTAGEVFVAERSTTQMSARRRRDLRRAQVGYVFQRPSDNLVPYLDAADHVVLAARLRGMRRVEAVTAAGDLLDVLGLGPRRANRPAQLSGGEQQRLAVAAAVVGGPALVVADEPTAELDSASADVLMAAIRTLAERGTAFVVATHDPRTVAAADGSVALDRGRRVGSSSVRGATRFGTGR